jgi:hypothetical protein
MEPAFPAIQVLPPRQRADAQDAAKDPYFFERLEAIAPLLERAWRGRGRRLASRGDAGSVDETAWAVAAACAYPGPLSRWISVIR